METTPDAEEGEAPPWRRRLAIVAGALAVTAALGASAFLLGAWGYETRRFSQHAGRLNRLLEKKPTLERVVEALEREGSPLLGSTGRPDDLERLAAERGQAKAPEILERGRRWPHTRVFLAGDMVYFIFFDEHTVMADFVVVSR
jgi:hypothetical protein